MFRKIPTKMIINAFTASKTALWRDPFLFRFIPGSSKSCVFIVAVMQASPRVGVRWSVIILNGLSYKDAGEYRCQARNMAGISEAAIELKVVGVTSRLPRRKSAKPGPKPSSKYRKPYKSIPMPGKDKQTLQNVTSSYFSKEQTLNLLRASTDQK